MVLEHLNDLLFSRRCHQSVWTKATNLLPRALLALAIAIRISIGVMNSRHSCKEAAIVAEVAIVATTEEIIVVVQVAVLTMVAMEPGMIMTGEAMIGTVLGVLVVEIHIGRFHWLNSGDSRDLSFGHHHHHHHLLWHNFLVCRHIYGLL